MTTLTTIELQPVTVNGFTSSNTYGQPAMMEAGCFLASADL